MSTYKTKYKGSVVGLIKAIKVQNLLDFLNLEIELGDDVKYTQIDCNNHHGTERENNQKDELGVLMMKVGDVNLCKYTLAAAIEFGYNDFLQDLYAPLFEREPELVHEVLNYIVSEYKPKEFYPIDPHKRNKTETQYVIDTVECFRDGTDVVWSFDSLTPLLENFKILSDALSSDKNVFQLANLLEILRRNFDHEEFKQFKSEIIDFIIKYDYSLDYGVAPYFVCMCHDDKRVYELFEHLEKKTPDLKEDMLIFLTKQLSTNKIERVYIEAHEREEVSFIENKKFAQFLLSKNVFPSDITTSLESLTKAHFMFIAGDKKEFDAQVLLNLKPNDSISKYVNLLDYDDKKLFIKSLADNKTVHELINVTFCAILEELLFDKNMRNFGIGYHLVNNYTLEQKKESLKEVMNTLASEPFNFQQRVKEILEVKLSSMNEEQEKNYFDIMTPKNDKIVNKVKI
jgi:hypothetical protein